MKIGLRKSVVKAELGNVYSVYYIYIYFGTGDLLYSLGFILENAPSKKGKINFALS